MLAQTQLYPLETYLTQSINRDLKTALLGGKGLKRYNGTLETNE